MQENDEKENELTVASMQSEGGFSKALPKLEFPGFWFGYDDFDRAYLLECSTWYATDFAFPITVGIDFSGYVLVVVTQSSFSWFAVL